MSEVDVGYCWYEAIGLEVLRDLPRVLDRCVGSIGPVMRPGGAEAGGNDVIGVGVVFNASELPMVEPT